MSPSYSAAVAKTAAAPIERIKREFLVVIGLELQALYSDPLDSFLPFQ